MRLIFDITPIALGSTEAARTGVYRSIREIARRLAADDRLELLFSATGSPSAPARARELLREDESLRAVPLVHDELPGAHSNLPGRGLRFLRRRLAPGSVKPPQRIDSHWLEGVDLFHATFFPIPEEVRKRKLSRVVSIHDLMPLMMPENFGGQHVRLLDEIVRSIDEETHVIVSSSSTMKDVEERLRIEHSRISVIPLAASPETFFPESDPARIAEVRRRYGTGERYLLALSTLEPRKNLARLVEAYSAVADRPALAGTRLVLAGATGWQAGPVRLAAEAAGDRVVATGFVPDEDLAALYSGATVFVFPSLHEGFGLPVLEAMQCGTAVIASNRSSIPEVTGESAVLFDPESVDQIAVAILEVFENEELRRTLGRLGLERARQFSWESTVNQIVAVYEGLGAGH